LSNFRRKATETAAGNQRNPASDLKLTHQEIHIFGQDSPNADPLVISGMHDLNTSKQPSDCQILTEYLFD